MLRNKHCTPPVELADQTSILITSLRDNQLQVSTSRAQCTVAQADISALRISTCPNFAKFLLEVRARIWEYALLAPQLHIFSNNGCSRSRTELVLTSCAEAQRIARHIMLADYNAKLLLRQRLVNGDITQEDVDAKASLHFRLVYNYHSQYPVSPNNDTFWKNNRWLPDFVLDRSIMRWYDHGGEIDLDVDNPDIALPRMAMKMSQWRNPISGNDSIFTNISDLGTILSLVLRKVEELVVVIRPEITMEPSPDVENNDFYACNHPNNKDLSRWKIPRVRYVMTRPAGHSEGCCV